MSDRELEKALVKAEERYFANNGIHSTKEILAYQRAFETGWNNAQEQSNDNTETCKWTQDDYESDSWNTDCHQSFIFNDGTPEENSAKFCTYCGKPLEQVIFEYDDEGLAE